MADGNLSEVAPESGGTEDAFTAALPRRSRTQRLADPSGWPSDVKVYLRFKAFDSDLDQLYGISYRNDHHYTDYRCYRVSVKMMVPQ